jgi:rubrerythrin
MEISESSLKGLVREIDEQHRDGMTTMASDIRELHAATRQFRTSRRGFLKKTGMGGAALTIGSVVLPVSRLVPAGAQELDDKAIATFAASVEHAAVEAYKAAGASGKVGTAAVVQAATTFAGHHAEHAKAFEGAAGGPVKANAKLLAAVGDQLKGAKDERAVLEIALDLENAAAATYLFGLGALKSPQALQLAASILPIEAQHAVAIGLVLGKSGKDLFPAGGENNAFETREQALDPSRFPAA